eukprot:NODE_836_length_3822_cov_0.351330.p2 type:complete len:114 gc:universal NODE_836_length_3822_cov_0.351330:1269-928(-)
MNRMIRYLFILDFFIDSKSMLMLLKSETSSIFEVVLKLGSSFSFLANSRFLRKEFTCKATDISNIKQIIAMPPTVKYWSSGTSGNSVVTVVPTIVAEMPTSNSQNQSTVEGGL